MFVSNQRHKGNEKNKSHAKLYILYLCCTEKPNEIEHGLEICQIGWLSSISTRKLDNIFARI